MTAISAITRDLGPPGKPGFGFLEWSDSLNLPSSAIIK